MKQPEIKTSRLQLMLVATLFMGPLVVAMVLYYGDFEWRPVGFSNHGALLSPITNVVEPLSNQDTAEKLSEHWSLLFASHDDCGPDTACREGLYKMRQVRLMLGKNMDRVQRVLLPGSQPPAADYLAAEQLGLVILDDDELIAALRTHLPNDMAEGGFFLVDPIGNLVMYFEPDLNPRHMLGDLKRLLSLSHIG
jgi:hypothetical protein